MIYPVLGLMALVLDFVTKMLAKTSLQPVGTIPLVEDVFHLTYVENRGAAFGILQNQIWVFVIVAALFGAAVLYLVVKYRNKPWLFSLGITFMAAGALGNTIDRVWRGYVVDFLDFRLIDFPVFNVADIFVCLGAGLLAIFFVFMEEKFERNVKKDDSGHR